MKKIEWETPNKMHFDSAFKEFNKQVCVVTTGNVYSKNQLSSYIRPMKEGKGAVDYDCAHFSYIPTQMLHIIYDAERDNDVILYEFRVWKKNLKSVLGFVLTDDKHKLITWEVSGFGNRDKRMSVIKECIKYIAE